MKIKINKKSFVIFITVALIILFFSGYSIGREITRTDISGNADIAKPILVIDDEEKININSQNKIGTYKFTIKNFDDNG